MEAPKPMRTAPCLTLLITKLKLATLLLATSLAPLAAAADKTTDPAGGWKSGNTIKLDLHSRYSKTGLGTCVLEVNKPGLLLKYIGSWKIIPSGRWKGYIIVDGMIASFLRNGRESTPGPVEIEFLLGIQGDELMHIKGGNFPDNNGGNYSIDNNGAEMVVFKRTKAAEDLAPLELEGQHAD